jgi:hypothetical protein
VNIELTLTDDLLLLATVRRIPPEPDAGFPQARFEVEKIVLRATWKEPARIGHFGHPAYWTKHDMDLTGADFASFLRCYQERIIDAAQEEAVEAGT